MCVGSILFDSSHCRMPEFPYACTPKVIHSPCSLVFGSAVSHHRLDILCVAFLVSALKHSMECVLQSRVTGSQGLLTRNFSSTFWNKNIVKTWFRTKKQSKCRTLQEVRWNAYELATEVIQITFRHRSFISSIYLKSPDLQMKLCSFTLLRSALAKGLYIIGFYLLRVYLQKLMHLCLECFRVSQRLDHSDDMVVTFFFHLNICFQQHSIEIPPQKVYSFHCSDGYLLIQVGKTVHAGIWVFFPTFWLGEKGMYMYPGT